jgi:Asp-tRNA(Asn)/Glu-tRNA(Gln) amidotransferase C subunit
VPPTYRAVESQRPPRPDDVHPSLPRQELFSNAPDVEQNQFRVPPILDL